MTNNINSILRILIVTNIFEFVLCAVTITKYNDEVRSPSIQYHMEFPKKSQTGIQSNEPAKKFVQSNTEQTIIPYYAAHNGTVTNDKTSNVPIMFPGESENSNLETETSPVGDIWANVTIAKVNGFMMPIITPVEMSKEEQILKSDHTAMLTRSVSSDTEYLPVMCGEYNLVPGSSLYLSSPYYPANYPDKFSCRWSINAVAGEKIAVSCQEFSLGKGDYLAIGIDGESTSLQRFTEDNVLDSTVLSSNKAFLSFFSDDESQSKGFSCKVSSMGVEDPAPEQNESSVPDNPSDDYDPKDNSNSKCGEVNRAYQRIVNGQSADLHEYPWQVYISMKWDNGVVSGCGGSIISSKWIITAAHCVMTRGSSEIPDVTVYTELHNFLGSSPDGGNEILSSRIVVHPQRSFSYDLALVELSEELEFSSKVMPICLPVYNMKDRNVTDEIVAVTGWGNTENGSQPQTLRELSQRGLDWRSCKKIYGEYITDHHFCTTSSSAGHICLGDSGGPTMIVRNGLYYLIGVISFVATPECNLDYPDGHTSVPHFLDWINSVTEIEVM